MSVASEASAEWETRVVALGREGLGRGEVAERLGLSLEELARLEAERPSLQQAMARAETAARAWWEALPREALAAGVRFNVAGWLAAMQWRFGEGPAAIAAKAAAGRARPKVIFDIPDNGRERRRRGAWPAGGG